MPFSVKPELNDLGSRAPTLRQFRWALAMLVLGVAAYVGIYPFAETPVSPAVGIVALYGAGLAIASLFTALLLAGQVQVRRSAALFLLAAGHLFSSLMAFAYTLLFPGLISVFESMSDSQVNDLLYLVWHGTFSLCVLGYALLSKKSTNFAQWRDAVILLCVLVLLGLALRSGLREWVPSMLADSRLGAANEFGLNIVFLASVLAFLAVLQKRPHTLLDLWLSVVMLTWVLDITLATSFENQAFDVGFYVGRICALLGSIYLLVVLLIENFSVHARLRLAFDEMIEARAREKSNELLAAVLRQLPEGVFIFNKDGRSPIVNERGATLAGNSISRTGTKQNTSGVMAMVQAQANRAAKLETFDDELIENVYAGERRVFSVSGAAVRSNDGELAATVVVVSDVTERIEAEQALKQSLERTRALLENTPLAALEWGSDRTVRRWSKRAEELFGWAASDIVGKSVDSLPFIHPEDVHTVDTMMDMLVGSSATYVKNENRNLTRDKEVLQCEWHNSALRNQCGEIETVFSLALDITERKHAMDQLRDADGRKDAFIATLAHELRNPLAPIANAASLLMIQRSEPERVSWLAAMISRQSVRMGRLLDDLLDVSRISRGKIELRKEPIELTAFVHETLQISMPLIEAGRHHLNVILPSEPIWVDADPVRIAQIMSNLLNNSAKYTPPNGRIEVRLVACDGQATFSVSDNGIGIEPDMLSDIFQAFVQIGSARHLAQGGLGIGLSLARGLAELHGGSLSVASGGKGRGATFTMCLPLTINQDHSPAHRPDNSALTLDARILVADDNVDAAESMALLLRARGADVAVAYDGEQALQMFSSQPARIAILDLGMPHIDGLEVARRLSNMVPKPYLIALTGRGRKEDLADSQAAGFDEHLIKPVDLDRFDEILRRISSANTSARK